MHLDDVENESAPRVEQYLSKIKVIRRIAGKIITFLAQLEDFQKALWLKKKFVVETQYCVTLKEIPKEFHADIAANKGQLAEWKELYGLEAINGKKKEDMANLFGDDTELIALSPRLQAPPSLMIDTRHFPADFTSRLIEALGDLPERWDSLLVHGENYQALRFMSQCLAASVDCSYIDPPYNTGNDGFNYKDNYRDSSWLSFLNDRIEGLLKMARNDAALFVSIDDNEVGNLVHLVKGHSPSAELVTLIAAQLNPRGRTLDKYLAKTHEYVATFALFGAPGAIHEIDKGEAAQADYSQKDAEGAFRLLELRNRNPVFHRGNRPNLFYPFFADPVTGNVSLTSDTTHSIEILPRNSAGEDGCWTWGKEKTASNLGQLIARQANTGAWRVFRKDRLHSADGSVATTKAKSLWLEKDINNENGKELLGHLFGHAVFDFPKPVAIVQRCVAIGMANDGVFIDFFAGSGTSGHALVNLNREDGGRRRSILVEMADYFDTVLLPRLKKVTFSPEWKDGKPSRLATSTEAERGPRLLKVVRLESYEDTLNNLEVKRTTAQQNLLNLADAQGRTNSVNSTCCNTC